MTTSPTPVGHVIPKGAPIPDDVTEVDDCDKGKPGVKYHWVLDPSRSDEPWRCVETVLTYDGGDLSDAYGPLTVTAVREPEPHTPLTFIACGKCAAVSMTSHYCGEDAQPTPSVLSLPSVPEGTVALIDRHKRRLTLSAATDLAADGGGRVPLWESESGALRTYSALLAGSGPLTVVLREPRSWPRIDDAPKDLKAVRGSSGETWRRNPDDNKAWDCTALGGTCVSFADLQAFDGPLTEVFDGGEAS